MSFRTKVVLGLAVLMVAAVGGFGLLANAAFDAASTRLADQAFDSTRRMLDMMLLDRAKRASLMTAPLERDARVKVGMQARAGEEDRAGLKGKNKKETDENTSNYFGSWMDEFVAAQQDVLVLIGNDGKVAWGRAGTGKGHVELGDDFLEVNQVADLIAGLETASPAVMLWSGQRFRHSESPVKVLDKGIYLAEAVELSYPEAGTGQEELAGVALLATSDLDLSAVAKAGADVVFVDHGEPVDHTFAAHPGVKAETARTRAAAAARWLSEGPRPAKGQRASIDLAGATYWAMPLEIPGLVDNAISAAVLYSREDELAVRHRTVGLLWPAGALLVILALGLGIWFANRHVTAPVETLAAAANHIGRGNLDFVLTTDLGGEVGDLFLQFNQMVVGLKERRIATEALGRYLSPEMAHELVTKAAAVELNGQRKRLTVLFSDIAGFTTLAEQLQPEQVVAFLNRYLDAMVAALFKHGAYIDKFEGDAIMAFWNAPVPQEDHAIRACFAAMEMRDAVAALAPKWAEEGLPGLAVRWGVNTGDVVVGNMGTTDKVNYTVIGDQVNLASRLEGVNTEYGTTILIGEGTIEATKEAIEVREVDLIRVKGRETPVRIYELLARKGSLTPAQEKLRASFGAGLALYRQKKFAEAKPFFEEALAATGGSDGPSKIFIERCTLLIATPPGDDWDGAHVMTSK